MSYRIQFILEKDTKEKDLLSHVCHFFFVGKMICIKINIFLLQIMGCLGSKDRLTKEDMEFLKTHTRYDEATIKEWYKGFKVNIIMYKINIYIS